MNSPTVSSPRAQAGPLPVKAGEMGYSGPLSSNRQQSFTVDLPIPARHPADREAEAFHPVSLQDTSAELFVTAPSDHKSKSNELCGVRVSTLVILAIQVLVVSGTGVAWFFAVQRLTATPGPSSGNSTSASTPNTILIITHVAFALAALIQLIFIERRIYHLRAERYAYTHRNQTRRLQTRNSTATLAMSFAPWNRPPLPTYAFALAQSGHSTGDVEDSRIAIAPPPAYGQTRQTKMLQQGYLRDSLRRARPVSVHSIESRVDGRPMSYHGDHEKVHVDADAVEIRDDAAVVREVERIMRTSMDRREPASR